MEELRDAVFTAGKMVVVTDGLIGRWDQSMRHVKRLTRRRYSSMTSTGVSGAASSIESPCCCWLSRNIAGFHMAARPSIADVTPQHCLK